MAWFDDLTTRIQQANLSDVTVTDIGEWLDQQSVSNTIAVAKDAGANLTALQLAQGVTAVAATAMPAPAHSTPVQNQNAQQASSIQVAKAAAISLPVLAIIGFAAYFFLMKGKRRA